MMNLSSHETSNAFAVIHRRAAILFFALLLLTIVVTVMGWQTSLNSIGAEEERKFQATTEQVTDWISNRVIAYHIVLRGLTAFYQNSDEVTLDEWSNYVRESQVLKYYPGVSSFGLSMYVPHEELEIYNQDLQRLYPDLMAIPNDSPYEDHYIATFIEPYLGREKAIGRDFGLYPERRRIIEKVRDGGGINNTKLVDLVTTNMKGFLLMAPIYRQGTAIATVEQRRDAFLGIAFAAFRTDEPFSTLFVNSKFTDLDIEVYNNGILTPDALLYDSDPHHSALSPVSTTKYKKTSTLTLEDHEWTVVIVAKDSFELDRIRDQISWIPFFSAGILVLILMVMTWQQIYMHKKVLAKMT